MSNADIEFMKRSIFLILIISSIVTFSAAQTTSITNFSEEGQASWYGRGFEGRPTASGEIYNPALLTAAHRTLPFNTIVTVTNLHNMRQVTVRINDRGPFVAARIIDLSEAAAEALDMINAGLAQVLVISGNALHPAVPPAAPPPIAISPQPAAPAPGTFFPAPPARILGGMPPSDSPSLYRLQIGAYSVDRNAVVTFEKLRSAGLDPRYEQSGELIRVVLSGLRAENIPQIAQSLGNSGFYEAIIRVEN